MFKKIDHVEIIPGNADVTVNFYTRILNFKIKEQIKVDRPPMKEVIYLELGDTMIELISVQNPSPKSANPWQIGYRMFALEVEDMDEAITYLKSKGVVISMEPVNLGNSKRAEIKDPDGLPIELRQW
jgi:glyoxylase I family protein